MNEIIAYLTCFFCGGLLGWCLTVVNWRISQTDFKMKYESAAMTNNMLLNRVRKLEKLHETIEARNETISRLEQKIRQLEPIG